jgi:Family of unknown function (DUF6603)
VTEQSAGTLDAIIVPISEALGALGDLVGADGGAELLADLGYKPPPGSELPVLFGELLDALGPLADALQAVVRSYEDGSWEDPSFLPKVLALGRSVGAVVTVAQKLPRRAETAFRDFPEFLAGAGLDQLPRRLIDLAITRQLRARHPRVAATLDLLGLLSQTFVPEGAFNPDFMLVKVHWERFPTVVADPRALLAETYGWGDAGFDDELFRDRLGALLWLWGIAAETVAGRDGEGTVAPATTELSVPLYSGAIASDTGDVAGVRLSLRVRRSVGADDPDDAGLALAPHAEGSVELSVPVSEGWSIRFGVGLAAEGFAVAVRPKSGVALEAATAVSGRAGATLARDGTVLGPLVLLGSAGATRLEVADLAVELAAALDGGQADAGAQIALNRIGLVIQAGEGDGFLGAVLPAEPLRIDFDLTVGVSAMRGVYVVGGAGLDFSFRVNAELGPIFIETLGVVLKTDTEKLRLQIAVDAALALGPFAAAVQGIGIEARAAFGTGGSAGGADLTLGFKPPVGVGIAINAELVSGGGFLALDYDAGRYVGVFELTLANVVSVKAIAIINTKFADGSTGFALLIMITAEGFTPIQLGMGFSLTGIGGLLALNRTVNAEAVRSGLQDGVLDSILFVKDPIRNINRILATLDKVFPLAPDRFVIGPLAEISWGAPVPLVKLRVALLLEVPQPIRVILLAALSLVLPDDKKPVVELHVDAIGVLDLGRGELALDASLHHSRLLTFSLTGDMALRLNWGSDPMFVLSIGGFHPKFAPPRGLRPLNRLALTLTDGDNPRVRFETYLALTSNTIQMGARVSLYAEFGGFGVDGGGGFDALIQWSPFALDVAFSAWVRIFGPTGTLLAAALSLNVTGPTPWHVTGQASLQILFFTLTVGVDLVLGGAADPEPVEKVDIAKVLWAEVGDRSSWQAVLSGNTRPGVTLTPPATAADTALVAHPLAVVSMRQKVVPLDTPISRIGAALPTEGTRAYTLDVSGPAGMTIGTVHELFAPAQYTEVPEDTRLGGPSFTPLPAGVSMQATSASDAGPGLGCNLAFETLDVVDLDLPAVTGDPIAAETTTALSPADQLMAPRPTRDLVAIQGLTP